MVLDKSKTSVAIIVCAWPPGGGGIGNTAFYHAKYLDKNIYEVNLKIDKNLKLKIGKKRFVEILVK